jgi:hypothetical protein
MYATYPTHHVIFLVFADHECFMDESFGEVRLRSMLRDLLSVDEFCLTVNMSTLEIFCFVKLVQYG